MTNNFPPLSDDQKDFLNKADLLFKDAHRKAKSLKRISRYQAQRARVREVLASLREGLKAVSMSRQPPP